jgi:hypothetical protein
MAYNERVHLVISRSDCSNTITLIFAFWPRRINTAYNEKKTPIASLVTRECSPGPRRERLHLLTFFLPLLKGLPF